MRFYDSKGSRYGCEIFTKANQVYHSIIDHILKVQYDLQICFKSTMPKSIKHGELNESKT